MTWLIWRQHRLQLALAAVAVIALAIPISVTARHLNAALRRCQAARDCGTFDLLHGYGPVRTLVDVTVIVPLLIGVFCGATIVGRELDSGTAALVWTQSVSRRRWTQTKLLTLFTIAVAVSGAVTGLVTWWSNALNSTVESRFSGLQFDIEGVAPIGYAVFAAALGLAAGVLWRRVLPAIATTVAGFIAVRLLVELFARPHYLSPVVRTTGLADGQGVPLGSLVLGSDIVLHGRVLGGGIPLPAVCAAAPSRHSVDACMQRQGYLVRTTYQPAGRYWTFQWVEFGIFAALAAGLTVIAVLVLRRRDA
jgi:hypothetical protein